jgi:uncharacterized Zn-binding protein involved in type VI secretion
MGKPAARLGDSTAHGGVIVKGEPTVMIGGMPAARVSDNHVCPMMNPGTPPPPHVGGPITGPGVPTVLIKGMPAAVVGDMATCSGPPDTIVKGCPTVLIGPGSGGGGGMAGGGGGGGASARAKSAEVEEGHTLDVSFEDKGGLPAGGAMYTVKKGKEIVDSGPLTGRIKRSGVEQGNYDIEIRAISKATWSKSEAEVGDKLTLSAKTAGIENDTPAQVVVYMRDINSADRQLAGFETKVSGDKVEVDWTFTVDEKLLQIQQEKAQKGGYSSPTFFFTVEAAGCQARSGILRLKDWIEIELRDKDGNPMGNKKYRVHLPNGEIRKGTLDGNGYAKIDKVPPGRVQVAFDIKE